MPGLTDMSKTPLASCLYYGMVGDLFATRAESIYLADGGVWLAQTWDVQ